MAIINRRPTSTAPPLRSYADINPTNTIRPMVTRQRAMPQLKRRLSGFIPTETYQSPHVSRAEILNDMVKKFNAQPVSISGGIATKSMAKPELPREMAGHSRFSGMFSRPQAPITQGSRASMLTQPADDLSFQWKVPNERGPAIMQRNAPSSDRTRQLGYGLGVSGIGSRSAMLNPGTFRPDSMFKIPTRPLTMDGSTAQTPSESFGGSADYTTGEYRLPPSKWGKGYGTFGRNQSPQLDRSQYKGGAFFGVRQKPKDETIDPAVEKKQQAQTAARIAKKKSYLALLKSLRSYSTRPQDMPIP